VNDDGGFIQAGGFTPGGFREDGAEFGIVDFIQTDLLW
jgi:hypothetical protein